MEGNAFEHGHLRAREGLRPERGRVLPLAPRRRRERFCGLLGNWKTLCSDPGQRALDGRAIICDIGEEALGGCRGPFVYSFLVQLLHSDQSFAACSFDFHTGQKHP